MEIKVLGPGCAKCAEAEKMVRAVLEETGASATVEKVSDFQEMAKLGVFSTPGVVVDGKVVCTGRVPAKNEIKAWIGR